MKSIGKMWGIDAEACDRQARQETLLIILLKMGDLLGANTILLKSLCRKVEGRKIEEDLEKSENEASSLSIMSWIEIASEIYDSLRRENEEKETKEPSTREHDSNTRTTESREDSVS